MIKVGSAVLADSNGYLAPNMMSRLARLAHKWFERGSPVVLVSSGAIAAGRGVMGEANPPRSLPEKQALAAIGQSHLMRAYTRAFGRYDRRVAQVLLTREDMDDRRRYLNAGYTLECLLQLGVVPIINENDTTAVEEIEFGDNDVLAAMVAVKIQAKLLLILTTVDGLMSASPAKVENASLIPVVERVTDGIEALADNVVSPLGRGGFRTKILAAQTVTRAGIPAILANGRSAEVYKTLEADQVRGTLFLPEPTKLRRRGQWILSARSGRNRRLIVDEGAQRALITGKKSLLAAGVDDVQGQFEMGDVVDIAGPAGRAFACGLANYSADEVRQIKRLRSNQIAAVLGRKPYDEVIHRDNMVMLQT